MYVCIHAPDAGAVARSFSPWVELIDAQTAVFWITPRQMPELTRVTRAAVASTIEAAVIAARNLPGLTILEPGKEAGLLGSLPLDCLPPDPEIFETLDRWGIRSLAEFARLPERGIAERLGARGLWLQKLARGALDRPLKPVIPETTYEASIELDHPLELLEPLLFLIHRFLNDLCARLEAQSLAAGAVCLKLNAQERILRLPFPTRDVRFLRKLIEHDLDRHPANEPIEKIALAILPTAPRRVQQELFIPAAPEPEKLELTLGKIRGLVGTQNVRIPEIRDTYRPGWGRAESRLAFRYFRPVLDARVETESGVPKHVATRAFRGSVMQASGPWRSSGEWWRPGLWNRDEWDLTLPDGLYRLYCQDGSWFIEGFYD